MDQGECQTTNSDREGGSTLNRISAEARREKFVEAAIKVMAREGLDHATTRRIAEEAGAPQGIFHYVFRDKTELLAAVIGAVTQQVERLLREAVDPRKGLAATIQDAVQAFWEQVLTDDGPQLMQYEQVIRCRQTPGMEWLLPAATAGPSLQISAVI